MKQMTEFMEMSCAVGFLQVVVDGYDMEQDFVDAAVALQMKCMEKLTDETMQDILEAIFVKYDIPVPQSIYDVKEENKE